MSATANADIVVRVPGGLASAGRRIPRLNGNAVSGVESFSIAAAPGGWTLIVRNPINSTLLRGAATSSNLSQVAVTLDIPTTQSNKYWISAARMYISAQIAKVYNAYMGQVELTGLPQEQFDRLEFSRFPAMRCQRSPPITQTFRSPSSSTR